MTLRSLAAFAALTLCCATAAATAEGTAAGACRATAAAIQPPAPAVTLSSLAPDPKAQGSGWTFEGCFIYFRAGLCRDVFRDTSGDLWICSICGTTSNPRPKICSPLDTSSGEWCS